MSPRAWISQSLHQEVYDLIVIIGSSGSIKGIKLFEINFQIILLYFFQDFLVCLTVEGQFARQQCADQNACAPRINFCVILLSIEDFRSLILTTANISLHLSELLDFNGESEVGKLHRYISFVIAPTHQNVFQFNIPMNNTHLMNVVKCRQQLNRYLLHLPYARLISPIITLNLIFLIKIIAIAS